MQERSKLLDIDENIAQCQTLKKYTLFFVTEVILIMFLTMVPTIKYSVLLKVKKAVLELRDKFHMKS